MPAPYSQDLRERLLRATDAERARDLGWSEPGVSGRTLRRWRARLRDSESPTPKAIPGRPRRLSPEQEDQLVAQVVDQPDATLAEHRDRLAAEQGVSVSVWTVGRIVRGPGLPLKESR